jgi:dCTP deaminase
MRINMSTLDDPKATYAVELEEGQFFELLPGELVVAMVLEKIQMPDNLMATLYPRSSLNRRGLSINLTGIVDAGYVGNLIVPIENKNQQPVRIYPGERFCQLTFHLLEGDVTPKRSRWHNADLVMGIKPEDNGHEQDYIESGRIRELKEKFAYTPPKRHAES